MSQALAVEPAAPVTPQAATPTQPVTATPEVVETEGSLLTREDNPDATAEPAKPDANAPEVQKPAEAKLQLTLPKDSLLPPERIDEIAAIAKEQGLSDAQAQKLLEREDFAAKQYRESSIKTHKNVTQVEWPKAIQADSELGGQNFKQSIEHAQRALKSFGSESLINDLDRTGYGNNPELIRLLSRIGKAMSDDKIVMPGSHKGPEQRIEDVFYPNMKKE